MNQETVPKVLENAKQKVVEHLHWAGTMDALPSVQTKTDVMQGIQDVLLGKFAQLLYHVILNQVANQFYRLFRKIGIHFVCHVSRARAISAKLRNIFASAGVAATQFVRFVGVTLDKHNKEEHFDVFVYLSPIFVVPYDAFFLQHLVRMHNRSKHAMQILCFVG